MGQQIVDYCREQPILAGLQAVSALWLLFIPSGFFLRLIFLAILIFTTFQSAKKLNF